MQKGSVVHKNVSMIKEFLVYDATHALDFLALDILHFA